MLAAVGLVGETGPDGILHALKGTRLFLYCVSMLERRLNGVQAACIVVGDSVMGLAVPMYR